MTQLHGEAVKTLAKHSVGAVAAGAAAQQGGRGLLHGLSKHPLLVLGLGMAAGYLIHKYRREIVGSAARLGEKGKDFVLQQRESLEDILADSQDDSAA